MGFSRHRKTEVVAMAEDLAFTGIGQDYEFMGKLASDRARLRPHRNGFQAYPVKGPQIGNEHAVI